MKQEHLEQLAHPNSYQRGVKYYKEGKVQKYEVTGDLISGIVTGTEEYKVSINLTSLHGKCNCYAFRSYSGFCKHIVAVATVYIEGGKPPQVSKKRKKNSKKKKIENKKENLDQHISELSSDELRHVIHRISNKYHLGVEDIGGLHKQQDLQEEFKTIKSFFKGVRPYGNWHDYVDTLDSIAANSIDIIDHLATSHDTFVWCLDLIYWLSEKKLTYLDDSDGIISSICHHASDLAVSCLNDISDSSEDKYIDNINDFVSRDHSFSFGIDLVATVFDSCTNEKILSHFHQRCEKNRFKRDSHIKELSRINTNWLSYLKRINHPDYSVILAEVAQDDVHILIEYIKLLYDNEEYGKVVRYTQRLPSLFRDKEMYQQAMRKISSTDEYLSFLLEQFKESAHYHTYLDTKKSILKEDSTSSKVYLDKLYKVAKGLCRNKDLLEIHLDQGNYNDVAKSFIASMDKNPDFTASPILIRLELLSPENAGLVYRRYCEQEVDKIKAGSSHYKRLYEYFTKLADLGDTEFLTRLRDEIITNYPNKKTLCVWLEGCDL